MILRESDMVTNNQIETKQTSSTTCGSSNATQLEDETASSHLQSFQDREIMQDFRPQFIHGEKGAAFQKYIVLHETEIDTPPAEVVRFWDKSGRGVAAHFVIGKDGTIVQCAPLDALLHHSGFGDAGHNELYGVEDESRDDKQGAASKWSWATDYGMNSRSIGIEMVHVGGKGSYPTAQLLALDYLISYIDDYYGFESRIIDHKAWRTGNSDTSPGFAFYLAKYQEKRRHS